MNRFVIYLILIPLLIVLFFASPALSGKERKHEVFFPNTAYELNIYRISGKNPGKTLLLIGGIQGNEPGGFLSADLYADMSLSKGNLIVVPRANFYSIILNHRGPHGDMNRKFTHEDNSFSIEDKIVTILKKLISESDYLLNLHDGSGYYFPTFISKWRNPSRFGQSVIADCATYTVPETGKLIPLGEIANRVIDKVNIHISNDLYKFHFMNTRTSALDSQHKEQRKSATYYALTIHNIPAFGVETSKFLPSTDLKVWFHNLVINSFMEEFGIIPQSPGLALDSPFLKYIVVSVNGETPIVIKKDESLILPKGAIINVSHIESNYERGLSLDILGYGDLNDYRKEFEIFRNTTMIIRKDNQKFGEIPIIISEEKSVMKKQTPLIDVSYRVEYFSIEMNDRRILLNEGETMQMVRGDRLKIIDVFPPTRENITVNFKGFVGDKINNTGEDRGYLIDTGKDLMERYSTDKNGNYYQIIVSKDNKEIGKLNIRLTSPKMDYLVLRVNNKEHILLRSEESITLSPEDRICMEEMQTNLFNRSGIHMSVNGHKIGFGELRLLKELCESSRNEISIKKGPLLLGKFFVDLNN